MPTIVHEVRATRTATPVLVQATEPVPGLFVYEQPDELRRPNQISPWRIGHQSGLVIANAMYESDAIRGAKKIADLADWTLPADELRRDVSPTELYEALSWANCDHPAYA
ncbi:hypothetical protein ACWDBO_31190 [Streptomyces mirabilis]|uniref:hypothetical protein n=1 Tax=Streptomyces mirabilis TaxID=68239 RepID=UPI0033261CAB